MASPLDQFQALHSSSEFVFVVYYRGHWCPFCISYLRDLQSISESIRKANGIAIAVTAEPENQLAETRRLSGYHGEVIIDGENKLAAELKSRGLLDVAITSKSGYSHGVAQPAVLVMKKDGSVLYNWAIVPSLMNLKGALDRPSLLEIWEDAELQLQGQPMKRDSPSHSRQSFMNVMKAKILG